MLEYEWNKFSNQDWESRSNNLDDQILKILLGAERKCRNLRVGTIEYSLELSRAGLK